MGKTATEEEINATGNNTIPLHLGDPDAVNPNLDLIGDDDDDDLDPVVVALQEQMEELRTSQKDEREFLQNTILEMSQRPAPVAPVAAAPAAESATTLDLEDLPDPVENRAEFNTALAAKMSKFVTAQNAITTAAVTTHQQTASGLQDLDNRFSRDYKDLAKKPALFQAVVTQEVAKLKNRGQNPQQFIFADPDKFLAKIAANMKTELGIDPDANDDGDGDDDKVVQLIKTGQKVSRTKSVRGGSMPSLKKGDRKSGKKPLSFVQEMKKQQHAMGLI